MKLSMLLFLIKYQQVIFMSAVCGIMKLETKMRREENVIGHVPGNQ